MLYQELDGRRGAHTPEGVAVVAAGEDAEVNELIHADVQLLQRPLQGHLQNLLLLRLRRHEIADEDFGAEGQAVCVLRGGRVDLAVSAEGGAGGLRLARRIHHRHAHEFQELLRLLVLLPRDADRGLGALEDLLAVARLHGGLQVCLGVGALLAPRIELLQLQLRRLAVEDVDGLDARLHELDSAREHSDDVGGDVPFLVG
mmetsp:Transcript_89554/g.267104  ORF Transcript_89554/g.267104 Transcript_89554/m.267104 type:complete len:201 (+) Transcript_89554:590-1192(+)